MSFKDITIDIEYRSLSRDVIQNFYLPILGESTLYDRAVGFFSSTALIEISYGLKKLVDNGGRVRLLVSPKLSEEDLEAIEFGYANREEIIEKALIKEMKEPINKFQEKRLNLLANLIATQKLDLKLVFVNNKEGIGIFHEKLGLVKDIEGNELAFSGSANESRTAFKYNYETIDVFSDLFGEESKRRVAKKREAFDKIWNNNEDKVEVIEFPNVILEKISKYDKGEITEDIDTNEMFKRNADEFNGVYYPVLPSGFIIRDYQNEAVSNWKDENYQGIFDMATGTGKTYTGLLAIQRLFTEKQRLCVIIVCPYQHLVEQWVDDIEYFGMKPIVGYSSSKQKKWKKRFASDVNEFRLDILDFMCAIFTNATFSSEEVQKSVRLLKKDTVLVVDEAHNFGAENLSKTLLENIPYRLALSATIDRHGDEDGTKKLYDYFGEKCIEYTLEMAINSDMLTQYYYYPIVTHFKEEELEKYIELSKKIASGIRVEGKKKILSDFAKMLLIKRARLVAAANDKVFQLKKEIEPFKEDNHMLIYCGATTMHDVDYIDGVANDDERRQIDLVATMIGNDLNMKVSKFTSEEDAQEREKLKREFSKGEQLQALIAIRCLDEGVNIPSIEKAFILASSTNPKEYIQRRGRVLRKSRGKKYAYIYDFIMVPVDVNEVSNYDEQYIHFLSSLVKKEIKRMLDFSRLAKNERDSDEIIYELCDAYHINIYEEDKGGEDYE